MILLINKLREIYSNDVFIIYDIILKVIAIILVSVIIRKVLKLRKFYSKSLHDKHCNNSYDNNCEYCNDCEDYNEEVCEDEEDYSEEVCEDKEGYSEEAYDGEDCENCNNCPWRHICEYHNGCEDCEDYNEEIYEDKEDYNEEVHNEDRELSPNEKRKQTMIKKYGVPYAFMLKRK